MRAFGAALQPPRQRVAPVTIWRGAILATNIYRNRRIDVMYNTHWLRAAERQRRLREAAERISHTAELRRHRCAHTIACAPKRGVAGPSLGRGDRVRLGRWRRY
jgi:hypothetical protein